MRALLALFALALAQTSCSDVPLSYYDQATYAQLTSLKAEATALVESFDTKPVEANEPRIEATSLSLRKAVEYEKGKGPTNSDTASQVEKINQLFHDDVKDYRENGPATLGPKFFREAAVVLGQAFDVAIATENLKNPARRPQS